MSERTTQLAIVSAAVDLLKAELVDRAFELYSTWLRHPTQPPTERQLALGFAIARALSNADRRDVHDALVARMGRALPAARARCDRISNRTMRDAKPGIR